MNEILRSRIREKKTTQEWNASNVRISGASLAVCYHHKIDSIPTWSCEHNYQEVLKHLSKSRRQQTNPHNSLSESRDQTSKISRFSLIISHFSVAFEYLSSKPFVHFFAFLLIESKRIYFFGVNSPRMCINFINFKWSHSFRFSVDSHRAVLNSFFCVFSSRLPSSIDRPTTDV